MMPKSPRFSVILPVYNGAAYLENAVSSILQQTFKDFELLIGDDGSQDQSPEIIANFQDPRIRQISRIGERGLFRNLNQLLRESRGSLIHIFCQDDVMTPECLASEAAFFETHPTISMSYCKATALDQNGQSLGAIGHLNDLPDVLPPFLTAQHFYYHGCIPGNLSTVCLRKRDLDVAGLFREDFKIAGDLELWTRFCRNNDLGIIHKYLVKLRRHAVQLSALPSSRIPYIREMLQLQEALEAFLPQSRLSQARAYTSRRHHVLFIHESLKALAQGDVRTFIRIVQALGPKNCLRAFFFWLTTANNRWHRPQAPWLLEDPSSCSSAKRSVF